MISAGHDLEQIRCYTLAQLRQFSKAIGRQERLRVVDAAHAARAGGLSPDDFRSFVSRMTRDPQ